MSEIKTIMEYFVRRVFGNANNLPADAASGTLLDHLLRIKDNIKVAYDWLHQRLDKDFLPTTTLLTENTENLLSNLQKLDNRKISNDSLNDGIQDGTSLVRLLCSDAGSSVTELKDDNEGWVMTKALPSLPNLEKVQLNCVEMNNIRIVAPTTITHLSMPFLKRAIYDTSIVSYQNQGFVQDLSCESVEFPSLEIINVNGYGTFLSRFNLLKKAYFPNLTEFNMPWQGGVVCECDLVEEIYLPRLSIITTSNDGRDKLIIACPNLKKVVFGKNPIPNFACRCFVGCTSLIHLEFSEVDTSLYLGTWNPTSVLSDSERVPIFLSNFKTYIANRLTDNGSGKTLTLSQAVRDAIEGDPTIAQIITSKGWTISPAPSV